MSNTAGVKAVSEKLIEMSAWLCTVESCTGGLLSGAITEVPGASQFFWGGFLTYHNSAKRGLGVARETLDRFGAVSSETAIALARGGISKLRDATRDVSRDPGSPEGPRSLISLSITGIAGPSGGTPSKPVGTCFLGLLMDRPGKLPLALSEELRGDPSADRAKLREWFTKRAIEFLLQNL